MTMSLRPDRQACLRGLYAVTPEESRTDRLLALVAAALDGGARLVQYRAKTLGPEARAEQARALLALCRPRAVPLIVNDDLPLALAVNADGVHLGRDDGDPKAARQLMPRVILGVSCYDHPDRAIAAAAAGADYVGIGSLFPSATKPGAVRAPLRLIAQARDAGGLPVAGIGGITADNATLAIHAGADMIAVVGALFQAPDVAQAAKALSLPFTTSHPTHVRTQPATL